MKPYYTAYDERYKAVHAKGLRWSGDAPTPLVLQFIRRYLPEPEAPVLEIGCGEGRDAGAVLAQGYRLLATDASPEAVAYCQARYPAYAGRFAVLDCLRDAHPARYALIYAVAVVHMLVPDGDRAAFYRFLRGHLTETGAALICTMGDGETERQTDIAEAFQLQPREHPAGTVEVAATSCRMVSFPTFRRELAENGLEIAETGLTAAPPDFSSLMYAVVRASGADQSSPSARIRS